MTNQHIVFEKKNGVASIALNRPDVRNAFHPEMIRELKQAFENVSKDSSTSVLVLRGEGKSFSSGADLGYMKTMADFTFQENEKDARGLDGMFWALRSCAVPVVAKVQGHVMGGALGLAALCDVVFAVEGTQFAFTEVRLGLAPAVISPYVLEKMEPALARQYMLTGQIFSPKDAVRARLVQRVGEDGECEAWLSETVDAIRGNGPEAVRATKTLLREIAATSDWTRKRDLTTKTISERRTSEEGQEGLRSFLEKRQPKWKK